MRAKAKARTGRSLSRHHHVLVEAHPSGGAPADSRLILPLKTRDRQVVHLCDAVVVIVVHLGGRNAG